MKVMRVAPGEVALCMPRPLRPALKANSGNSVAQGEVARSVSSSPPFPPATKRDGGTLLISSLREESGGGSESPC